MVTLTEVISIYDDSHPRLDRIAMTREDIATEAMQKGQMTPDGFRAFTGKEPSAMLVQDYLDTRSSLAREAKEAGWSASDYVRVMGGIPPDGIWDTAQADAREGQVGAQPR